MVALLKRFWHWLLKLPSRRSSTAVIASGTAPPSIGSLEGERESISCSLSAGPEDGDVLVDVSRYLSASGREQRASSSAKKGLPPACVWMRRTSSSGK